MIVRNEQTELKLTPLQQKLLDSTSRPFSKQTIKCVDTYIGAVKALWEIIRRARL